MIISELKHAYTEMHDAERKVADYILAYPQQVIGMSMAELSSQTGTSDATVMRVCKKINQSGFYQLKINLAMETVSHEVNIDPAETPDDPRDVVSFLDTIAANISQLSKEISLAELDKAAKLITDARTVFTFGWGNTDTVADDLAHRLLCYEVDTFTSSNIEYIMRRILLASEKDVLVAISRSGEAVYTIECCKLAKDNGLKVILITGDNHSNAAALADVVLKASPLNDVAATTWGSSSHIYELAIVDVLLQFVQTLCSTYDMGLRSEAVLGQFKN